MGYQPPAYTIEESQTGIYYIIIGSNIPIRKGPYYSLHQAKKELKKYIKWKKDYPKTIAMFDSEGNEI